MMAGEFLLDPLPDCMKELPPALTEQVKQRCKKEWVIKTACENIALLFYR
jgi:hypothetical protein